MEPRYYDAAGHINYEPLMAHAAQLRREAIDGFFSGLSSKVANVFAHLHRGSDAHAAAWAAGALQRTRRRSG